MSTQIQLSAGSAGFLPPEALPRFAFRADEDYTKKLDLIYELREVARRTRSRDVILSTPTFLQRSKVVSFFPPAGSDTCLINVEGMREEFGFTVTFNEI